MEKSDSVPPISWNTISAEVPPQPRKLSLLAGLASCLVAFATGAMLLHVHYHFAQEPSAFILNFIIIANALRVFWTIARHPSATK